VKDVSPGFVLCDSNPGSIKTGKIFDTQICDFERVLFARDITRLYLLRREGSHGEGIDLSGRLENRR